MAVEEESQQSQGGGGGEIPVSTGPGGRRNKRRRDRVRLKEGSRIREPGSTDPEAVPFNDNVAPSSGEAENKPSKPSAMLGLSSAFNLVTKISDKLNKNNQDHPLKRRATRRARAGSVRRQSSKTKRQGSVRSGSHSIGPGTTPGAPGTISRRPNGQPSHRRLLLDNVDPNTVSTKIDETSTGTGNGAGSQKIDVESGESAGGPGEIINAKPMQKTVKDHVVALLCDGWRQFQLMIGAKPEEIITVQEIIKEPIFEDLDVPHRYRPENLQLLCDATGFSVVEMKRIYRGFKTECPTGLITEEAFHGIYSRFFPQGAHFLWKDARGQIRSSIKPANNNMSKKEKKDVQNSQANVSSYSHYVFSTLDHEDSGIITFEDFVIGLSILLRGSVEEKARWMFLLYDQDRDGFISREEMEDVVGSVFDLMGRTSDPIMEEEFINQRVDKMFERMDLNGDGLVSLEEFLETCLGDENITRAIVAFSNVII